MQRFLVPTMFIVGILLIIVGSQWNHILPAGAYWSEEKAAEYTKAQVELHALSHEHTQHKDDPHSGAFNAAKERFAKIGGELELARSSRNRIGTVLIAVGAISLISAVILHFRSAASS